MTLGSTLKWGLIVVAVPAALFGLNMGGSVYRYGWASLFPEVDLKTATPASLAGRLEPGVATRASLFRWFGEPEFERDKVVYLGGPQGNREAERLAGHRSIQWRKYVGFYLIISMSSKSQVLTVYLNDDDSVHDFDLRTEY